MRYSAFVLFAIGLVLFSGCGSPGTAVPAEPSQPPTATGPASTATPQPVPTGPDGGPAPDLGLLDLAEVVPERTPLPTATPDALAEGVQEIIQRIGLAGKRVLWLQYEDWINLGISLLVILAAYLIGTWLIHWLLPRLVRRTQTVLDDRLLRASGSELRWLAVVFVLHFATKRLAFIDADAKVFLSDFYFSLGLILAFLILWRLIRLAAQQALDRADKAGHREGAESLITLSVWALRLLLITIAISLTLTHFGVNITGFAVLLGLIGLALSLAGRDLLADIISGALILIDRPYRVGDRIDLPSIDSWGDVVDIGMRSTRILTLDNRMVIVPNSQVSKDQIVNYCYPDPSYYDMRDLVIAYDNDVERVGQLLVDTIRRVEGVQKERDIDALLFEFRENQMVFKLGWWIASYKDLSMVRDRVNRAVIQALKDAGVVLPYRRGSLHVAL